ncbi:hypothetical protein JA1_003639 [Spathaspora sp. JA1]|nr:hypothetical protein JA1_003639 [Spathaspora sp. JA1]
MLVNLPLEILHHITKKLDQPEIVNLSRTNSFFSRLLIPRLYSAVTVEATPKIFGNSQVYANEKFKLGNEYISSIKISSIYALGLFFKSLIKNREFCSFVKVLVFKSQIPDIEDAKLFGYLDRTICHMKNLEIFSLERKSVNVPLDWFNCGICKLQGKIVGTTPYQFDLEALSLINTIDLTSSKHINLNNLQELSILNSNDLHVFENLFQHNRNKIKLRKLVIENSHLDYNIADLLDRHLELNELQCLSIPLSDGCQPIKYNLFLEKLVPYMTNLSDLTFSTTDHRLLQSLKSLNLTKLKVLCHSNKFDLGLILASVNRESLLQLDIDYITDTTPNKCPISPPSTSIKLLKSFPKLKMLSIPVTDDGMLDLPTYLPTNLEMLVVKCLTPELVETSLVDYNCDHYWQSFQIRRETNQSCQFGEIVEKFSENIPNLKWVAFEKTNTYLYEIRAGKAVKHDMCIIDIEDRILRS